MDFGSPVKFGRDPPPAYSAKADQVIGNAMLTIFTSLMSIRRAIRWT
jgi:hypothetical protein